MKVSDFASSSSSLALVHGQWLKTRESKDDRC